MNYYDSIFDAEISHPYGISVTVSSTVTHCISSETITDNQEWSISSETSFKLSPAVSVPENGYVKAFIFDNMSSIHPLAVAYSTQNAENN